jgi:hypothetical protein
MLFKAVCYSLDGRLQRPVMVMVSDVDYQPTRGKQQIAIRESKMLRHRLPMCAVELSGVRLDYMLTTAMMISRFGKTHCSFKLLS